MPHSGEMCSLATSVTAYQSSLSSRVPRTVGAILCDLAIMLCPHTGLFISLAERLALASECRAPGEG